MAAPVYQGKRWARLKLDVLERDRWVCQLCRGPIDLYARPGTDSAGTADHVLAVSDGGAWWDPSNLRAAHIGCNRKRGAGHRQKVYPIRPPW